MSDLFLISHSTVCPGADSFGKPIALESVFEAVSMTRLDSMNPVSYALPFAGGNMTI